MLNVARCLQNGQCAITPLHCKYSMWPLLRKAVNWHLTSHHFLLASQGVRTQKQKWFPLSGAVLKEQEQLTCSPVEVYYNSVNAPSRKFEADVFLQPSRQVRLSHVSRFLVAWHRSRLWPFMLKIKLISCALLKVYNAGWVCLAKQNVLRNMSAAVWLMYPRRVQWRQRLSPT